MLVPMGVLHAGGVRGPGSGGHGWGALGCAQCLRGRGEGAAASRPALQGFRRWASGCALLLRGRNAGETESLRAA